MLHLHLFGLCRLPLFIYPACLDRLEKQAYSVKCCVRETDGQVKTLARDDRCQKYPLSHLSSSPLAVQRRARVKVFAGKSPDCCCKPVRLIFYTLCDSRVIFVFERGADYELLIHTFISLWQNLARCTDERTPNDQQRIKEQRFFSQWVCSCTSQLHARV